MREQETFAARLSGLINENSISHAKVGRVVGVSGQAVGKWAKGGNIEYENLQALATHFGVNWVWLRYGDDAITAFSERRSGSKVRRAVIKNIMDNEEMRIPGTHFYKTVTDEISPVFKAAFRDGEMGALDIYNVWGRLGDSLVQVLRAVHNGILSTYLSWALIGLGVLAFILMFRW